MQTYLDLSNAFLAKIVLTLDSTTSVGKVILQADWTHGYRQNLALILLVMLQNRHLADYSDHATIYMMSVWKRTTKRLVHVATCTRCEWNQVATLHKFTMEPTKEHIIQQRRLHESKYPNIHTKIQIIHKANSIRVRIRIQMGLRGLKINDGVQTLPRPSQKSNLANIVARKPVRKNQANGCRKGGRKREKKQR
jgi:hypothetical protein